MILEVVHKSREAIQHAQEQAEITPRPANACPAHDVQFALTKALTGGMDTVLMLLTDVIKNGSGQIPKDLIDKAYILLLRPWPWVAISIVSFTQNFSAIIESVKGLYK